MNFTSQICTTEEQSKRLMALGLKAETADMSYFHTVGFEGNDLWLPSLSPYENVVKAPNYGEKTKIYIKSHTIPAWSLHRLIEMIPITVPDKSGITHFSTIDGAGDVSYYYFGEESWENWKSWHQKELYDNVIDCFEWLIKESHFNKEYLED